MITVDGREIKVSNVREQSLKTIIDAIEHDYLVDDEINMIQLACVNGACRTAMNNLEKEVKMNDT